MDWEIVAATVVIAHSALASLGVTWRLSEDNRALRKAGTEPEVVAYLDLDRTAPSLINLVLEYVGQGPACDVEFFVDAEPEDFSERGVRFVTARSNQSVGLLPQGQRIDRMLAPGWDLMSEVNPLPPFRVELSYANLRGTRIGPLVYDDLDVSQFEGALAGKPPDERVADAVEKIEKHLGHFGSDFKRLRLETITTAERQKRDAERRAQRDREAAAAEGAEEEAS